MAIEIRAFSNSANVFVAWSFDQPIPNSIGFALYRHIEGQAEPQVVQSSVGFGDDPQAHPGAHEPSTVWPFQRCTWNDWLAPRDVRLAYEVRAVFEQPNASPPSSGVSNWVMLTDTPSASGMDVYFNDGIIATQWVARYLSQGHNNAGSLRKAIVDPNNPVRQRLAGQILPILRQLLTDASRAGQHIYSALFELNDPELIKLISALGPHAHIVLANGSPVKKKGAPPIIDTNADARKTLKDAGVEVFDRIFTNSQGGPSNHLGHNKFMVLCDDRKQPQLVLTGSTNWSTTGLCTQMNNALVIRDRGVAQQFLDEWNVLSRSGAQYPPIENPAVLVDLPPAHPLGTASVNVSFTPYAAPKAKKGQPRSIANGQPADLARCVDLINAAKQAIFFLMFIPGPAGTLMEAIQRRNQTQGGKDLFVRGVANQDPGNNAQVPSIALAHRGELIAAPFDVVYPAAVSVPNTYWLPELKQMPGTHAMIHSKVVVLDPFGDNPVVMTGSNNMGVKASTENDENLVVIEGNAALAQAYALNVTTVFNQYWWRYNDMPEIKRQQAQQNNVFTRGSKKPASNARTGKKTTVVFQPKTIWKGLYHAADWKKWQTPYLTSGDKRFETDFWFERPMTPSHYTPPNNPMPSPAANAKGRKRKGGNAKRRNGRKTSRRVGVTAKAPRKKSRRRSVRRSSS